MLSLSSALPTHITAFSSNILQPVNYPEWECDYASAAKRSHTKNLNNTAAPKVLARKKKKKRGSITPIKKHHYPVLLTSISHSVVLKQRLVVR